MVTVTEMEMATATESTAAKIVMTTAIGARATETAADGKSTTNRVGSSRCRRSTIRAITAGETATDTENGNSEKTIVRCTPRLTSSRRHIMAAAGSRLDRYAAVRSTNATLSVRP